jgi:hypothetical protein
MSHRRGAHKRHPLLLHRISLARPGRLEHPTSWSVQNQGVLTTRVDAKKRPPSCGLVSQPLSSFRGVFNPLADQMRTKRSDTSTPLSHVHRQGASRDRLPETLIGTATCIGLVALHHSCPVAGGHRTRARIGQEVDYHFPGFEPE